MNDRQKDILSSLLQDAYKGNILITGINYVMGNLHSFLFVKYFDKGGNAFHRKYDDRGVFTELEV